MPAGMLRWQRIVRYAARAATIRPAATQPRSSAAASRRRCVLAELGLQQLAQLAEGAAGARGIERRGFDVLDTERK